MPRVTISVPNKQIQPYRFPLDRDDITLGRGRDNDIVIQSESVSVHHAKMRRVHGGYELRDLGSTNGLKLDGEKKIFVPLHTGMSVQIGEADFHFQLSDEELDALGSEAPAHRTGVDAEGTRKADEPKKEKRRKVPEEETEDKDPRRRVATAPGAGRKSAGASGGAVIVFLLLAAVAFFVGMSIRHQKETGGSLLDSMRAKYQPKEKLPDAGPEPVE